MKAFEGNRWKRQYGCDGKIVGLWGRTAGEGARPQTEPWGGESRLQSWVRVVSVFFGNG